MSDNSVIEQARLAICPIKHADGEHCEYQAYGDAAMRVLLDHLIEEAEVLCLYPHAVAYLTRLRQEDLSDA